ncbi:MAG: hypothetical protein IJT73_00480 [Selenomonadaceae bacterium]|nr:hypothetical protein [Selenomonadaceae bacterium]
MVERIEKIARVKPVDYDVGRRFDSRNHREDKKGSFLSELRRVINKKNTSTEIPEAYNLELSGDNANHLFYFGSLDLDALLR